MVKNSEFLINFEVMVKENKKFYLTCHCKTKEILN